MFAGLGKTVYGITVEVGKLSFFTYSIAKRLVGGRIHWPNTIEQMILIGTRSLPITLSTAVFVGLVFGVQIVKEFLRFGAAEMIGGVVGLALWRELAPLLTGVVVAGRVGAAISAELGSMKVTEQIEALETLSQDPINYLVVPRCIAAAVMLPLLVGMADIVSFLSGFLVAIASNKVNPMSYFHSAQTMLVMIDIYGGLIKAVLFGVVIAVIATYCGLSATSGAKGVGLTTTRAVVWSLVAIFMLNYLMSIVIF